MKKIALLYSLLFAIIFFGNAQQVVDDTYIFGVTIDDPWTNTSGITDALSSHCLKPTTRIVFDEWVAASEYYTPVTQIANSSFIMGEILDSFYVPEYSVDQYLDRTTEYLDVFEDMVIIWEIGNEVNGDWLGDTSSVVQKIEGAYNLVKARGKETALTLYFNRDCYYDQPDNEMFTWATNNISDEMKQGLDYVWVSYYEDDCEDVVLSEAEWQDVFDDLHLMFPNSKLGMGECGTTNPSEKSNYMERYYYMNITTPNYIGGYFWWYYKQDCVPKTKPLWDTMNSINCDILESLPIENSLVLDDFIIFPNPSTGEVIIQSNLSINEITIYSVYGEKVDLISNTNNLDLKDYPKGVYFLKINTNKGKKTTTVILK